MLYNLNMKYKRIKLPYTYDSLEPYLDARTVEIHYTKHHAAYEANFNKGLEGTKYYDMDNVLEVMSVYNEIPEELKPVVAKQGGGLVNHNFFFNQFRKDYSHEEGNLRDAFFQNYPGGQSKFIEDFTNVSLKVFGSGWAWAVIHDGKSQIITTPNQENPWMQGITNVVFGVDLWEHSYYLKYQQDRKSYVKACIELFILKTNAKKH